MDCSVADLPAHRVIRPSILYFGTPVVLVTTVNPDGTPNISPMSSAWALADRVVLGLTSASQGCTNAVRTGQCVINVAGASQWQRVESLARTTGRRDVPAEKAAIGYYFEPDKFAVAGWTHVASDCVAPPRIGECPLQLEAEVVATHAPGGRPWRADGGHGFAIIETRVVRVHAHAAITIPGTDHVDVARWQPLFYVFRHYVAAGEDMGRTFKAEV